MPKSKLLIKILLRISKLNANNQSAAQVEREQNINVADNMIEECNFLNTNEYLSNNNKLSAESLQIPYKSLKILNFIERRSREKKNTKNADQITDQNNTKLKSNIGFINFLLLMLYIYLDREYRLAGSKSTNLRDYNLFETLNNHNDFSTLLKTISK